jgi:hypothetical protein
MPEQGKLHADDDQVMFGYAASCNISFHSEPGGRDFGYLWKEWREMTAKQKEDAYIDFIFGELGVEVFVIGDQS